MNTPGKVRRSGDGSLVSFFCPGCNDTHTVKVGPSAHPVWEFNGNNDRPSFKPSIRVTSGHFAGQSKDECWCTYNAEHPEDANFFCRECHSFVTDGSIQFLNDCTHALAGQTVPLPDFPG